MAPINEALADLESREEDEHFAIQAIADHHGMNCSTLHQRWNKLMGPQSKGYAQQQLLNLQQEAELVAYIEDLSVKTPTAYKKDDTQFCFRDHWIASWSKLGFMLPVPSSRPAPTQMERGHGLQLPRS
jgi:hypothetical protein